MAQNKGSERERQLPRKLLEGAGKLMIVVHKMPEPTIVSMNLELPESPYSMKCKLALHLKIASYATSAAGLNILMI